MSETGSENFLRYDLWVEEALRGVIFQALKSCQEHGLAGDHHFYISFLTQAAGVEVPGRLRAQHPTDMTIVLQYQFDDLDVREDGFSVTLSFGGKKEHLVIPFSAVVSFADPSVNFALQLKMMPMDGDEMLDLDEEDFEDLADLAELGLTQTGDQENAPGADDDEKRGEVIALDQFRKKP